MAAHRRCRVSSTSTISELDVSFNDDPQRHETLRLTLRGRDPCDRIADSAEQIMTDVASDHSRIMASGRGEAGGITEEQANEMNKNTAETVGRLVTTVFAEIKRELEVQPGDSAETAGYKRGCLDKLCNWVKNHLKRFLQMIKDGIKGCWTKVKELFKKLLDCFRSKKNAIE